MAQLFCTGPALVYVGIPINWTQLIQEIFQLPPDPEQPTPQQSTLVAGKLEVSYNPTNLPGPVARLVNNQIPAPVFIFIQQLFTFYVPVFLGTTEDTPTIEIVPGWDAVETDAGGTENPSERLSEGEEAIIRMNMTRYNEPVYQAIAARSQTNSFLGLFPGFGQVGKAMALEGLTLPLWLVFPYTGKATFNLAFQPSGYRFFRSLLEGPDRLERLGTVPRLVGLQFRAQRIMQLVEDTSGLFDPQATYSDITLPVPPILPLGSVLPDQFADDSIGGLYDFSVEGLPAPN